MGLLHLPRLPAPRRARPRRARTLGCAAVAVVLLSALSLVGTHPQAYASTGPAAAASGHAAKAASDAVAAINSSAWYEVVNENSGLCASAAGDGTANGTAVEQLACTGATNQLWQFVSEASGYYEVLNDNAQAEGESWNITGGAGATASGDLLQTWAYGGATNELFTADQLSSGYYNFVADNSELCIDTPGASTTSGVQLQQYTCNGTGAQEFSLIATGIDTSAWYEVVNENSGLCASAAGGSTANGTAVEQLACTGATSQLWQFVPVATGYYEVLNDNAQAEGESWNITGGVGATASGDLLQTWAYGGTGATNGLFAADELSSGYYNFVADNSGLCIDTPGASTTSGVQLQQYTCNGTGAQEFSLVESSGSSGGSGYGGFPSSFWGDTSSIPSASGAIEFDFINATNGEYPDSEVYWDVNGVEESIAQSPYYTMSSCSACRIYFYLGSPGSSYNDFIELNSSGTTINADTSRVDAFGLPLAIHLHNSDNTDTVVGEDYQVFSETRSALFQQFEDSVPAAFQQLATVDAPYSIPAPSDVAAFQPGGADADYMVSYAASEGATETTQEVFGCSGGGSPDLSGDPTLCAALNRCVAQFSTTVQDTPSDYYQNPPCNYYSMFWHSVAVNGLQYGFAYDDVNGQSSDFSSTDAQYVQVAIGF
jgi:Beta-1,3-glucanase/Ricin-type beta-trefoil lectin domain-like